MEIKSLNVQARTDTGKGVARKLRMEGNMPAVLYGANIDSVPLSVGIHDVEQLLKDTTYYQVLIKLLVRNGGNYEKTVMIKELQTDPVSHKLLHVDFYEIKMDQKITTTIPIVTTGVSAGVEEGGILQIIRRELEVSCLPAQIPEQIEIDITDLAIGDSVHVEDIEPEGDVEILYDVNFTVLTVVSPKMEVEEEEEELEEGELEEGAEGEEGAEEGAEGEGEAEE